MNLPSYFLVDLPSEAVLGPGLLVEACDTLRRNRQSYLARRSTRSLIDLLGRLAANWLVEDFPFRRLALEAPPELTGFPTGTLRRGLNAFFGSLTAPNLQALVTQDLGHPDRLDEFVASPPEERTRRTAFARTPGFLVHIAAGNLPVPAWQSMILGLLCRSAQFVKCASGRSFLPRLFAHSLYDADPKLGACLELADWPGGRRDLEDVLYAQADCVTATCSDETLAAIRQALPPHRRFVAHGHKLSFIFLTRESLARQDRPRLVRQVAEDVVGWNQCGCLSPHVVFAESGGETAPEEFAAALADELARMEADEPRGPVSIAEAAAITSRRSVYQLRASALAHTRVWESPGSTAWTVVFEEDPAFARSCLNRFVYVKPVENLAAALSAADSAQPHVSTVALGATDARSPALARQLADWGASRICPVGRMQHPPPVWRQDGRPTLADLVLWTDWERNET